MGHPVLGRPQLIRLAFGSSVPEISPDDVFEQVMVPRLKPSVETKIADLMEEAAIARDRADALEVQISSEAETIIDKFLTGNTSMIDGQ